MYEPLTHVVQEELQFRENSQKPVEYEMLSLAKAAGHYCKLIDCRADPSSADGIMGLASGESPSPHVYLPLLCPHNKIYDREKEYLGIMLYNTLH